MNWFNSESKHVGLKSEKSILLSVGGKHVGLKSKKSILLSVGGIIWKDLGNAAMQEKMSLRMGLNF